MDWFDERIRLRREREESDIEEAIQKLAGSVSKGFKTEQIKWTVAEDKALEQIMRVFHITKKESKVSPSVSDPDDRLDCQLRPYGIMHREIALTQGWYKNCTGPVLGRMKDSGTLVAVLPNRLSGYHFVDPKTGKRVRLNSKTEKLLEENGECFYASLPQRRLTLKDLLVFVLQRCRIWDIFIMLAAMLAASLIGILVPQLNQMLFSNVRNVNDLNKLGIILMTLLLVTVTQILIGMIASLLAEKIQQRQSVATQAAIIMRTLLLPTEFFKHFSSGELNQHIQSACTLCRVLMENVCKTGMSVMLSVVFIVQVFIIVPSLALPSLIITLFSAAFAVLAVIRQITVTRKQLEISAKESGMTYELISGVQKIKMTGSENRAFSRWADIHARWANLEYNPPWLLKYNSVIQTAISLVGIIAIYMIAEANNLTVPDYMAFMSANAIAVGALAELVSITRSIASIKPLMEMIEPLLSAEPECSDAPETVKDLRGNIELNNISFRYKDDLPLVIDNLSLTVNEGEYVAIVGPTGCGKSTLIRLLLGFEKPQRGTVVYNHKDLGKYDLSSLRSKMGIVIQNGKLFHGDIFSNITFALPKLTLDDAWNAAEIAGIADDIRAMPMGMNTVVGGGNGGLSGGQQQRIMIARAVVRKPRVLIFDEATSSLDNLTQKKIADAIDRMKCTRIVVAHRLSTIRNCDRIVVLDNGKITEEGTFETLMARNGFFASMVERQLTDNEKGANEHGGTDKDADR